MILVGCWLCVPIRKEITWSDGNGNVVWEEVSSRLGIRRPDSDDSAGFIPDSALQRVLQALGGDFLFAKQLRTFWQSSPAAGLRYSHKELSAMPRKTAWFEGLNLALVTQ